LLLRDNNKMQEESIPPSKQFQQRSDQVLMSTLSAFFLGTEQEEEEQQQQQQQMSGSPTSVFGFDQQLQQREYHSQNPGSLHLMTTAPSSLYNSSCPTTRDLKEQQQQRVYQQQQFANKPFHRTNSLPLPVRKSSMKKKPSLLGDAVSFNRNNDSKPKKSIKPSVSFHSISVREYNIAMGDNPSCSYGIPISLGWEYQQHDTVPLSSILTEEKQTTNGNNNFILSYHVRRQLLKNAGYPTCAMRTCLRQVNRCKRDRAVTELFLAAQPLEDAMERVVQGVLQTMTISMPWNEQQQQS